MTLLFHHIPLLPFLLLFIFSLTHLPAPAAAAHGDGYTLAQCDINSDCISPRVCRFFVNDVASAPCSADRNCFCMPPNGLIKCEHCIMCRSWPNETCLAGSREAGASCMTTSLLAPQELRDGDVEELGLVEIGFNCKTSFSPTPTPSITPSPTPMTPPKAAVEEGKELRMDGDGDTCVDAKVFEKGQPGEKHDTLFSKHRSARVLCDHNGACATPGHIVVYEGQAMTMRRYCTTAAVVGGGQQQGADGMCESLVIQVNSPKYAPGVRILSKTTGLYFTALAARFETAVEEAVLRTAVRLGL